MATLRKRNGKWKVEIRKVGYPSIHRTFFEKKDALKFAKEVETQMDKNQFEDYSGNRRFNFKGALNKISE